MNLPYIIEVQICIALFWVVYRLFMRRSNAFGHNRAYLLGAVALALILPALSIPVWPAPEPVSVEPFDFGPWQDYLNFAPENPMPEIPAAPHWEAIALWVYLLGVVILLGGVARHVLRMRRTVRRAEAVEQAGVKIVCHETVKSPYSFFRYIFINPAPTPDNDGLSRIVAHEMAHIRLGHSYDSLLAQGVLILFWWNPFVWLWCRSLKEVHEYQADAAVLDLGVDTKQYITLLIGTLADIHPEFVSGFSYSLLKNRLLMMTQTNTRRSKYRIALALPTCALLMTLFSFTAQSAPQPAPQAQSTATATDEPFLRVEVMPSFQGGDMNAFRNWAMMNVRYPKIAAVNGISGRVLVRFIVERDGSVSSVEAIESPDRSLSEETVRVVSSSPKWTPGTQRGEPVRVQLTLPINFQIPGQPAAQAQPSVMAPVRIMDQLIFVDGVKWEKGLDAISLGTVEHISVLKDKSAIAEYGEEGKNGVILITTRQNETEQPTPSLVNVVDSDEPFLRVETMPTFQGGNLNAFRDWAMMNVRYPKIAAENGISGRVTVQLVIERDGSVTNVEVLQSPDRSLSEEAVRVVSSSPKWTPGTQRGVPARVKFIIPIEFRIPAQPTAQAQPSASTADIKNYLILVDGEKWEKGINAISPDSIASISALKDKSALEVYGEEGKNGVILVTTKK